MPPAPSFSRTLTLVAPVVPTPSNTTATTLRFLVTLQDPRGGAVAPPVAVAPVEVRLPPCPTACADATLWEAPAEYLRCLQCQGLATGLDFLSGPLPAALSGCRGHPPWRLTGLLEAAREALALDPPPPGADLAAVEAVISASAACDGFGEGAARALRQLVSVVTTTQPVAPAPPLPLPLPCPQSRQIGTESVAIGPGKAGARGIPPRYLPHSATRVSPVTPQLCL